MRIIIGSQSKSRRELMKQIAEEFESMSADIDERAIRTDDYQRLPLILAHAKADALVQRIEGEAHLVTSDQVVVWNGQLREKPESAEEAQEYLKSYSSGPAQTNTAVVVTNTATSERFEGVDIACAYYCEIPEAVIGQLIAEGNVLTAAGGFRIEDPLLKPYLEKLEGSIDSVMGLPLDLTRRLLAQAQDGKGKANVSNVTPKERNA